MSARNGHIARHHRLRKQKIARRLVTRALRAQIDQAKEAPAQVTTAPAN